MHTTGHEASLFDKGVLRLSLYAYNYPICTSHRINYRSAMSYPHLGNDSPRRKKSKFCSKSAITKLPHVPVNSSALATFMSRTSSRRHSIYDRIGRWHSLMRGTSSGDIPMQKMISVHGKLHHDESPRSGQHYFAARCTSGTSGHAVLPLHGVCIYRRAVLPKGC